MEQQILNQVAKEFNLPKKKIEYIYSDWLNYIKDKIRNTDYSEYTGQLGFTFPCLGKIYVNERKLPYINLKKRIKENKNGRTEFKENPSKE